MSVFDTNISTPDNSMYNTKGGNDTVDKLFLLSAEEAEKYFSTDDRALPSNDILDSNWWLRTPGDNSMTATFVSRSGQIEYNGEDVDFMYSSFVDERRMVVRPAMWIDLSQILLKG